jgi:hypothetical protein
VARLDPYGEILWQKFLWGSGLDEAYSVRETPDGGFVAAGSLFVDVGGNEKGFGGMDAYVVKLSRTGEVEWEKLFGGASNDYAFSARGTADGGFIISGAMSVDKGPEAAIFGDEDFWVAKLNAEGGLEWEKTWGAPGRDAAYEAVQASDGGYICAGGRGAGFKEDAEGMWLAKLSPKGEVEWEKTFGGGGDKPARSVREAPGGGYAALGAACPDEEGGAAAGSRGGCDFWLVKVSSSGEQEWQKTFGGSGNDAAYSLELAPGGGYAAAGWSESNDGDASGNHGDKDFWLAVLGPGGRP